MSYILDALKKLEENRRQDHTPDLMTVHEEQETVTKKRSPWPYILFAAILLNAILLTVWLIQRDSSHQKSPVASANIRGEDGESIMTVEKSGVSPVTQEAEVAESSPAKITVGDSSDEGTAPLSGETAPAQESDISLSHRITPLPDEETDLPEEESGRIPDISELPSTVKEDLPEIKISGHVYFDTPEDRLVIVNGRTAREGDKVGSGIQIEEITTTGVIFMYDNRRFSMKGF